MEALVRIHFGAYTFELGNSVVNNCVSDCITSHTSLAIDAL